MGRKKEITKDDVLSILEKNQIIKLGEIAKELKCCVGTVCQKVKKLRTDGWIILPSVNGLRLVEDINTLEDADAVVMCIPRLSGYLNYILTMGDLSFSNYAKAVEMLNLDEDKMTRLNKEMHKLAYVTQGLKLDMEMKKGELPFKE